MSLVLACTYLLPCSIDFLNNVSPFFVWVVVHPNSLGNSYFIWFCFTYAVIHSLFMTLCVCGYCQLMSVVALPAAFVSTSGSNVDGRTVARCAFVAEEYLRIVHCHNSGWLTSSHRHNQHIARFFCFGTRLVYLNHRYGVWCSVSSCRCSRMPLSKGPHVLRVCIVQRSASLPGYCNHE